MVDLSRQEISAYLAEPHVAHMVTVRPDGRPHVAPVWFIEEDGWAFVMAHASAVKLRNVRRNPQVTLSVATDQRPFKYVLLEGEGRVTNRDLARVVERICVHYDGPELGPTFAREALSGGQMWVVEIRVKRVIGWKDDV
tara:strand:- start:21 stop:437 length:417 start_codon:yes stop_codon:yes gene_type:complete